MSSVYDIEICDCHHHLWDLDALYYPWLTDTKKARVCGDYEAIRKKNFLLPDFFENRGELKVMRMVHEEAVVDRSASVDESRWLQALSERDDSDGFPHGIVAYADFSSSVIEAELEGHAECRNTRGIRQFVHEAYIDPKNPKTSLLEDNHWRSRIGLCERYGYVFELQIYYPQVEEACALLEAHPNVHFNLVHTGQPAWSAPEHVQGWRAAISKLSAYENLNAKISGFGMFDRDWSSDSIRETVLHVIDCFGPDRCMFASNFPVDSLANISYAGLWESYFEIVKDFSDTEIRGLFSANACRVYRI